jgi:hypothetical protein
VFGVWSLRILDVYLRRTVVTVPEAEVSQKFAACEPRAGAQEPTWRGRKSFNIRSTQLPSSLSC